MADTKLTGLTEDTSPSSTDLVYTVKDPGGTPLSRKSTFANAAKALTAGSDTEVQYNNGGVFGGDADLAWDDVAKVLAIGLSTVTAQLSLPDSNDATTPTLAFGTSGIFKSAPDVLSLSLGGVTVGVLVGGAATQTLTNKTINTASNTLTVAAADITSGTLAHEQGGIEADISGVADGGMLVGTGAGTMAVRASALTAGAAGFVKHELGGLEFDASAIADGGVVVGTGAGTMAIRASTFTAGAAGFLKHEVGGLEADVNAYNGLIRIASGSTTNVTNLAGLNTALSSNLLDAGQYQEIWIDAGAMVSRTTNGAATATEEYATNDVMSDHFLFDTTTEEGVQFRLVLPDTWDLGTVKAKVYWDAATGASASDTVEWGVAGGSYANDDAIDAALGTPVTINDVVIAVGDLHVSPASGSMTIAGTPALGDLCVFEVTRQVAGTDDMAEDAKLLGVAIQYKELVTASAVW